MFAAPSDKLLRIVVDDAFKPHDTRVMLANGTELTNELRILSINIDITPGFPVTATLIVPAEVDICSVRKQDLIREGKSGNGGQQS